jgi:general secretion pathway protein A
VQRLVSASSERADSTEDDDSAELSCTAAIPGGDPTAREHMYLDHWGLRESPFKSGLNPALHYAGAAQEEALARVQFLVTERRRLGLVLGEAGIGKSLLLRVIEQDLQRAGAKVGLAGLVGLSAEEFAPLVCDALGLPAVLNPWQALTAHVTENRWQQISTVILLDDVDSPSKGLRDQITRLVQLDGTSGARLTVLLALAPENLPLLGHRLLELAELRMDLEPWTREETAAFVEHSLHTCGLQRNVFNSAAMDRLYELGEGVPRRIKQIADLALLAGAGERLPQIGPELIDGAVHELGVVTSS